MKNAMNKLTECYNKFVSNSSVDPTKVYVSENFHGMLIMHAKMERIIPPEHYNSPIIMFMGIPLIISEITPNCMVVNEEHNNVIIQMGDHEQITVISKQFFDSILDDEYMILINNMKMLKIHKVITENMLILTADVDGVLFKPMSWNLTNVNKEYVDCYVTKAIAAGNSVPKGAVLIKNGDRSKYDGKLISGWLFDSGRTVTGIKNPNGTVHGFDLSLIWQVTPEEIALITNYEI